MEYGLTLSPATRSYFFLLLDFDFVPRRLLLFLLGRGALKQHAMMVYFVMSRRNDYVSRIWLGKLFAAITHLKKT